jgi:hypothetical protein
MASHPLNLALRFLLELAALTALGVWGYRSNQGGLRYLLAGALPLLAACAWGVFAVPHDPSRSGRAPVPVPGLLRLVLELAFFGLSTWALSRAGQPRLAFLLGGLCIVHYVLSYDRIGWLLQR